MKDPQWGGELSFEKTKQKMLLKMGNTTWCDRDGPVDSLKQEQELKMMMLLFTPSRWLFYFLSGCDDKVLADTEMGMHDYYILNLSKMNTS